MHNPATTTLQRTRFRVVRLIWPFVAIVVLLLALGMASLSVMSGVRAYIGAQSAWSNAQKAAVESLEQYAQSHNEDYFDRYVEESVILAGARNARIELDKPFPDFTVARQSLRRSGSHPADISGMVNLFRRFRRFGFMAEAVRLWAVSDMKRRLEIGSVSTLPGK